MPYELVLRNYRCFDDEHPLRIPLERGVHAFVGPNNAGKTTALKCFYELAPLWDFLAPLGQAINVGTSGIGGPIGVTDYTQIFCNRNNRPLIAEFLCKRSTPNESTFPIAYSVKAELSRELHASCAILEASARPYTELQFRNVGFDPQTDHAINQHGLNVSVPGWTKLFEQLRDAMFVPSLRTAASSASASGTNFRIGQHFIEDWRNLKFGPSLRDKHRAKHIENIVRLLFGFDRFEMNVSTSNNLDFWIDGSPYALDDIGSGIANSLYALTRASQTLPSMLIVDEPEISLHPGMQTELMHMLMELSKSHVYFATHSIGLARSVANTITSIYRDTAGVACRPFAEQKSLAQFLGEMSFASWSDLGLDALLLVEGASDISTFRHLLAKLEIREGVMIVHLGGSAMITGDKQEELAEFRRLNRPVFVVIDSEKKSENESLSEKRARFLENCRKLGFQAMATERRATENYLSERALKVALGENKRSLGQYESLESLGGDEAWGKRDNWRAAKEMSADEIIDTDLGKFLLRLKASEPSSKS